MTGRHAQPSVEELESSVPGPLAGLQAIGVTLWVLSQLWPLLNLDDLSWVDPLDLLFASGQPAVYILLTCAGYSSARLLLAARLRGSGGLVGAALAQAAGIAVVTVLGVASACLVVAVDHTDETPWETLQTLMGPLASFDWNLWLIDHPLAGRLDLTALWPLSVVMQLLGVLTVAVLLLGRWRPVLLVLAVGAAAGSIAWQTWTLDERGWFVASLHTVGLAAPFLMGVAVAVLATWHRPRPTDAGAWLGAGVLAIVVVLMSAAFVGADDSVGVVAPLMGAATALACLGAGARRADGTWAAVWLGSRQSALVGGAWLSVVAMTPVVVAMVARHSEDQPVVFGVALTLVVLAVAVLVAERVRTAVTSWLSSWPRRSPSPASADL